MPGPLPTAARRRLARLSGHLRLARHEQPHQQPQRRRGAFTESAASAGLGSLHVLLIRHGESANNQLWRQLGHDRAAFEAGRQSDPPLSDDGEAQVDAVAEMLERLPG